MLPLKSNAFKVLDKNDINSLEIIKEIRNRSNSKVYTVKTDGVKFKLHPHLYLKVLLINERNDFEEQKQLKTEGYDDFDFDSVNSNNKCDITDYNLFKRFLYEYELVNNLYHPNIIRTFGIYFGNDSTHPPSILFEFFRYSLYSKIHKLGKIELILIVYEICDSMNYIHEAGIVHHNLIPENILIDQRKHAKICNFSRASMFDVKNQDQKNSFFSDKKEDVYSFGEILYFIVAKEKPKFSLNDIEKGMKIQLPNIFTQFAHDLILKCFSLSANDRPEFKDILSMIVDNNFQFFDGIDDQIQSLKKKLYLI